METRSVEADSYRSGEKLIKHAILSVASDDAIENDSKAFGFKTEDRKVRKNFSRMAT